MINYLVELSELKIDYTFEGGVDEVKVCCPFHADEKASLGLNTKSGVYHCFACDASGHFITYLAAIAKKPASEIARYLQVKYKLSDEGNLAINPLKIEEYHAKIWEARPLLDELYKRAITDDTIRRFRLGYAAEGYLKGRITIPISNPSDEWVNIRYYMPGALQRKMLSMQGRNKPRLYPYSQASYPSLAIVAGEIKALAALSTLNQHDIGALSPCHTGEGKWHESFTPVFNDKDVYIIMDVDAAGRRASQKIAKHLYPVAKSVKIIKLDFPEALKELYPKGGVDDFLHVGGDLLAAISSATVWEPPSITRLQDEEPVELEFAQAFNPEHVGLRAHMPVSVTAVGDTPFFLPEVFEVHCARDAGDICSLCPVFASKSTDPLSVKLHGESPNYLRMIDAPTRIQHGALSAEAGIPHECRKHSCKVVKHLRAEEANISPIMDLQAIDHEKQTHQPCLLINADVQPNSSYNFVGRMYPHPLTQRAVFVASSASATGDDLSNWTLQNSERLHLLRPEEWTLESLSAKLKSIYNFLSCEVTKTYERTTAHIIVDLTYHSALFIPFLGETEKGWVESLIIGDSAQGKTQIVSKISKFYNLGIRYDCKNATTAGLLGGFIPLGSSKRLFVQWGALVRADRKLLIMEEAKGASLDTISRMTEARSSGLVQLVKVETKSEKCRSRAIWISNARSDRSLATHTFGIEAAKELIGAPEDLRRFDVVLCLEALASYDERPREPEQRYPSDIFRDCVLFAWTRSKDQIVFESEEFVLQTAAKLLDKYAEQGMPLLDKGWTKLKVARLATALAARTFSTINEDCVFVRNCHVEFIGKLLDDIYSHPSSGYAEYSKAMKLSCSINNAADVKAGIDQTLYPQTLIENLLLHDFTEARDIEDWAACSSEQAQSLLSLLVRNRALVRRSGRGKYSGYTKTQGFIEFLRKIDLSAYDKRPEYLKKLPEM